MPPATRARARRIPPRTGLAGLLLAGLLGLAVGAGVGAQPETPRAGLVILDGQGKLHTFCVDLGAPEINGLELLQASGVDLVQQQNLLGSMVCRIGDTGCDYPAEACWCQCQNLAGDCRYWAYHQLADGDWRYGLLGPSSRRVRHGDVDGWAWGPGSVVAGARPPLRSFEQICAASEPGPREPTSKAASPAPPATARPTSIGATAATGPTPTAPSRSSDGPEATLRSTGISSPSTRGAGLPGTTPRAGDSGSISDNPDRSTGTADDSADAGRSGTGDPDRATSDSGAESSSGFADDSDAADGRDAVAMAPAGRDAEDVAGSGSRSAGEAASAREERRASNGSRRDPGAADSSDASPTGPSAITATPPDARTLAGYLLFGLIFLGLVGIALSGRRR